MNCLQWAVGLATIICGASAIANEVHISNHSPDALRVTYQRAYHNPGHPVVYNAPAEQVLPANGTASLAIRQAAYQDAGIVVLAIKKPNSDEWIKLPHSATEFGKSPGCWVAMNAHNTQGEIILSERMTGAGHGRITCRVLSA